MAKVCVVCMVLCVVPICEAFNELRGPPDREGCEDEIEDCPELKEELFDLTGHCRYPAAELCMKTCGLCRRVRLARRCEVSSCHPFCVPQVDWVAFLQAAVERAKPEIDARLLSYKPVLAEFPHFLSTTEVEALSQVAWRSGFQREDDLPQEVRDVHKVDCERRSCLLDPLIQEIYQRLSDLLGIPPQNFESMEFLLYEKGQHYEPHMDDERWWEMPALSAGLRVLTVFFYLSKVHKGGETSFPNANLVVEPLAGKAVVWANVQSNIWKMDEYSLHQAVPVVAGRKIAANFWVHPFEYRAAERFCRHQEKTEKW
ncbi:unnamed protein product [Durusdinium trenchii]|uniref:Fe2OG dioxygenase domain-containing protein n=1 Tax=Durusdinium trenchii TaxID=1381693 RepID=A0ABP0I089_9DINO